jgi:hypothetical protein
MTLWLGPLAVLLFCYVVGIVAMVRARRGGAPRSAAVQRGVSRGYAALLALLLIGPIVVLIPYSADGPNVGIDYFVSALVTPSPSGGHPLAQLPDVLMRLAGVALLLLVPVLPLFLILPVVDWLLHRHRP